MLLGCIGDDFTGSSDLANTLAKGGMHTVQYTGVPDHEAEPNVDAGVVALKTRSIAPSDAVAQSLAALAWLQSQGCQQIFFKYCSTFDSTAEGNIGPVAEALAQALDATKVIVCPAFPATGRAVYQGHLFVNGEPLHESSMRDHPITPMTDSDLRRWLKPQTTLGIGHIDATTVFAGSDAIANALDAHAGADHRLIVVDAIRDEDLLAIGQAACGLPLITGGSGVALGLPANFGYEASSSTAVPWQPQPGRGIALSGSCSETTRRQVANHSSAGPSRPVNVDDVISGALTATEAAAWLLAATDLPLLYSSADPDAVAKAQRAHGADRSAQALEGFFAQVARLAVAGGVTRIITAGGETSGAVVEGLRLDTLRIGPEIDPGVPALRAADNLVLALKSGNFGRDDFFASADRVLGAGP